MKKLIVLALTIGLAFHVMAQHDMGSGNLSSCSGTVRDPGGPNNYGDNLDVVETYCSDAGNCINISFSSFSTEGGYDYLKIYDGNSTSSPLIGRYEGTTSPGSISSSTGCLTFQFHSDVNTNRTGWEATLSCSSCPVCDPPSALGTVTVGGFDAQLTWTENGTATAWDIEWGLNGFSPTGTPTLTGVSTNPYYLSGLASTTSYDYYVRANCGGLVSSWVGPYTFTTTALPPGSTCGDPFVLSLPFSATNMNTAGFGDNYNDVSSCTTSGYLTGNDYVMQYTPSIDECITINIQNMSHSYGGLFLLDGCPDDPATSCLVTNRGGFVVPSGGLTDISLTGGETYYIVVSSDPFGGQTLIFDLDITNAACPTCFDRIRNGDEVNVDCGGSCAATCGGTTCSNPFSIPSLPYSALGVSTAGMGDDYNSTDACGSDYLNGDDYVYEYTATAADTCNIRISLEHTSTFNTGLFVFDGCPDLGTTNCVASQTDASTTSKLHLTTNFTPGVTYYIVVSSRPTPQSMEFDINITNTCPPQCGVNPIAEDLCSSAAFISNLDGFCGNTSASYTPGDEPSVFCGTIENNSWFKFTADSTSATINAFVSNCTWGRGIQIEIYETSDCINFTSMSNCWNPGVEEDGSVTANGLTIGNDYYIMVDGNDGDVCDYTIGASAGVSVPLELARITDFTVHCNPDQTMINWTTSHNPGGVEMIVEKSDNGKDFYPVYEIRSSEKINKYSFPDNKTSGNVSYYRLKQVNESGEFAFTKVIARACNLSETNFKVFPNPAKNRIVISGDGIENASLKLFNTVGQEIRFTKSTNKDEINMDVEMLPRGIYVINLKMDGFVEYKRVVLE